MFAITKPTPIPNPIAAAEMLARSYRTSLDRKPGVFIENAGDLTRVALDTAGLHRRKKAGRHRNEHTVAVRSKLASQARDLYMPRAAAKWRSLADNELMGGEYEYGRCFDEFAMIPGDQFVVVVDKNSDCGSALFNEEVSLPPLFDNGHDACPLKKVQRSNALDVLAVSLWLLKWRV